MNIYVDVDDVLSKTTETYPEIIKQMFGKSVAFEDLATFDLQSSFRLTDQEFHDFFDCIHQEALLLGFELVDGALTVLNAWADAGHTIDIVTGRPTSVRKVTLAWLDRNQVPYDQFIMVDKYNRPGNDPSLSVSKAVLAKRHYDLAVEDSADMALYLADTMGVETALMDKPWNQNCPDRKKVIRCQSWSKMAALWD
ncbi:MAG: bifunctional metallophosphatase/5'-nucleotidase [Desulfobacterales bacterium]|nr:MAG: bifunctional metallophosphatase/5'-nucleotidase [Desulfobacterales bacterium]